MDGVGWDGISGPFPPNPFHDPMIISHGCGRSGYPAVSQSSPLVAANFIPSVVLKDPGMGLLAKSQGFSGSWDSLAGSRDSWSGAVAPALGFSRSVGIFGATIPPSFTPLGFASLILNPNSPPLPNPPFPPFHPDSNPFSPSLLEPSVFSFRNPRSNPEQTKHSHKTSNSMNSCPGLDRAASSPLFPTPIPIPLFTGSLRFPGNFFSLTKALAKTPELLGSHWSWDWMDSPGFGSAAVGAGFAHAGGGENPWNSRRSSFLWILEAELCCREQLGWEWENGKKIGMKQLEQIPGFQQLPGPFSSIPEESLSCSLFVFWIRTPRSLLKFNPKNIGN